MPDLKEKKLDQQTTETHEDTRAETEAPKAKSKRRQIKQWEDFEDYILIRLVMEQIPRTFQSDSMNWMVNKTIRCNWTKIGKVIHWRATDSC